MPPLPEPISHTVDAIWKAYEKHVHGGDSLGVAISQVAEECQRKLFYIFRWAVQPEPITSQKKRRFETGNREEKRLLDNLADAGIKVRSVDPETGKQWRVDLVDGWLRGKLDAIATGVPEASKAEHVVETKAMNEKRFNDLKKKKLELGNPSHYAQCQLYMHATGIQRCLYVATNTNDDNIYAERIKYNRSFAERMENRVRRVVNIDVAPPKLFNNPDDRAAYACQWCVAKPQCHERQFARENCRTCIEISFRPGAVAYCGFWKKELTYDEQQAGCASHIFLPSLVPGTQIDADEETRTVTYKMPSGETWVDGG